ncbi:hypothetical protein PHMEG_00033602 [Phytophthora megakarya]|uniref:Uncharacterized protein n=1 Tax=Phytophthora megakarya TaxID=4795 RepID=A0A225UT06_9STRA|nr:hypothetical protein PHMEG_00033602 [Phytophthora megakarya]
MLEKSDMVAFTNGEENIKAMREDGWNFGNCVFDAGEINPTLKFPAFTALSWFGYRCGGPTDESMSCADSLLKLFFSFMPKRLWRTIAEESNRYFLQNLTARIDRTFDSQTHLGSK